MGSVWSNRHRGSVSDTDDCPLSILKRGKRGFGPPLKYWFGNDLASIARDRLRDAEIVSSGLVRRAAVDRLLQPRRSGKVDGATIWRLLVLESWLRGFSRATRC